jgi:hypothetical protein
VQARADVGGQQAVASDHGLLGDRRPSGEAEPTGQLALVHLGTLREPRLLRVLGNDAVERLDVLQRSTHQHRVAHAMPVVGEDPHPRRGVRHRAELGQLLAGQTDGDRTHRVDVAVAALAAEAPHLLDDAGRVGDRIGVGHRMDRRVTTHRSRLGAGQHGFGVLAPGLAEVGVEVHQARQGDQPRRIDHLVAARPLVPVAVQGDAAVLDQDVGRVAAEEGGVPDQVAGHASAPSLSDAPETAGSLPPSSR